jgi:hypothetical protein
MTVRTLIFYNFLGSGADAVKPSKLTSNCPEVFFA